FLRPETRRTAGRRDARRSSANACWKGRSALLGVAARLLLGRLGGLLRLVSRLAHRFLGALLEVLDRALQVALRLVELALVLRAPVVDGLAGDFLDLPLQLVDLSCHSRRLLCWETSVVTRRPVRNPGRAREGAPDSDRRPSPPPASGSTRTACGGPPPRWQTGSRPARRSAGRRDSGSAQDPRPAPGGWPRWRHRGASPRGSAGTPSRAGGRRRACPPRARRAAPGSRSRAARGGALPGAPGRPPPPPPFRARATRLFGPAPRTAGE